MHHLSLFVDEDTFIHRLNPLTKIIYVLAIIAIPLVINNWGIFALTIGCSVICLMLAHVFRQAIPLVLSVLFLLLTIIVIQSLFGADNKTILWQVGKLTFYREGFLYAMKVTLNVINLILAFALFILTTKPSEVSAVMTSWGISPKIAYIFGSVFQIIPQLFSTMQIITDAQRSRGMETDGNLLQRIRAFFPLISPVIMNALVATKERAIALEVRGFNISGKRSYLYDIQNTRTDILLDCSFIVALIAVIIWRLMT